MEDIVAAAIKAGLDELGYSDHYVLLPDGGTVSWSMKMDCLDSYFESIAKIEASAPESLSIRRGLEIDYFPETADQIRDIVKSYPFDYVIGSVHFFNGFPIDECRENWDSISSRNRDDIIIGYWSQISKMAKTGFFDIVGHLDLYKKFGQAPTSDISDEIINALDAIAGADMAVELNTSGWHVPVAESYPSAALLRGCKNRNIPVLITADAHKPEDLTRDYQRAQDLLKSVGIGETVRYGGKARSSYTL